MLIQRLLIASALAICIAQSSLSHAREDNCATVAKTDLEKLYCEIKAEGEGKALPDFASFRQNSANIQSLLLKRDAAKLGLSLPRVERSKPYQETSEAKLPKKPKAKSERPDTSDFSYSADLNSCSIDGELIRCREGGDFKLVKNLPNTALKAGSLNGQNKLMLPQRAQFSQRDDTIYLSHAYGKYIDKMLDIGMGASTMSFSRFYAIYENSLAKGFSFTYRFASMYEFLKGDRKRNAIPSQLSDKAPQDMAQCELLRRDLIVCDTEEANWVYILR